MNKRGQIYILAALIFSLVIYLLSINLNTAKGTVFSDFFIEISNNYDKESAKFLTSLSQELLKNSELDVQKNFNEFSGKFTSYSKTINSAFGFIYFFDYSHRDNRRVIIGNHLDQPILVWVDENNKKKIDGCKGEIHLGTTFGDLSEDFMGILGDILEKCSETLDLTTDDNVYNVTYVVSNIKYTSGIIKGVPQIVILSEEKKGEERKVYTNHKFEKGENWVDGLRQYCVDPSLSPKTICDCNLRDEENCLMNDLCKLEGGCVDNE
ncbi:hypothetical protein HYV88_02200 [Candidatus Woesearchaeota archaeon]|nr:hypothetical protein [Candidatus Woesearchaeota archaeon]